ncbi:MAG: murein L,D-transpeptidase catalytic domain family protein [Parvularculaceae bacterium]
MRINRRLLLKGGAAAGAGFAFCASAAEASDGDRIVEAARELVKANASRIHRGDRAALVDFSLPSWRPRFHLVDLASGKVRSYLVAHGRGSDPGHTGFLQKFSNEIGSNATSDGVYRTGAVYDGKYGTAMRLSGLDDDNSNARMRAIVIHAAWYVGPDMIAKYGKIGRSEGCFAFSERDRDDVIAALGEGSLLYAGKF